MFAVKAEFYSPYVAYMVDYKTAVHLAQWSNDLIVVNGNATMQEFSSSYQWTSGPSKDVH